MSTVYEFGNAQFCKDPVFGWCFRVDGAFPWITLAQVNSEGLADLAKLSFPTYVTEDLKLAIAAENNCRKLAAAEAAIEAAKLAMADSAKMHHEIVVALLANHENVRDASQQKSNKITVMRNLLESMTMTDGVLTALSGPARVKKVESGWQLDCTYGEKPVEVHETIDKIVERILARWW